jgi:transposase
VGDGDEVQSVGVIPQISCFRAGLIRPLSRSMAKMMRELAEGHPGIDCVVASMVAVRDSLLKQVAVFDRMIRRLTKTDATARRLMMVPGVGPVVALAYMAVIDDPGRFWSSDGNMGAGMGVIYAEIAVDAHDWADGC